MVMSKFSNIKIPPSNPVKPQDPECCNRGCENCVFDYYERALKAWENKISRLYLNNKL